VPTESVASGYYERMEAEIARIMKKADAALAKVLTPNEIKLYTWEQGFEVSEDEDYEEERHYYLEQVGKELGYWDGQL
jgi:hypothetical protein